MECVNIPLLNTPFYHKLIRDYLNEDDSLKPLVNAFPSVNSLLEYAKNRSFKSKNREVLHSVLTKQYQGYSISEKTKNNLDSLKESKSRTIVTGHQICLASGPMYVIYKIASTIALCNKLNSQKSENHFVPILWLATEDHDFEEVNHFHVFGNTYSYESKEGGAVGPRSTEGILDLLANAEQNVNNNDKSQEWWDVLKSSYTKNSLTEAFKDFMYQLFDSYGLVILDPNETELKQLFIPQIKQELTESLLHKNVMQTVDSFKDKGYKIQVNPREINLFYLEENSRNRIVLENDVYKVLDSDISFTKEELQKEVDKYPQKFSPNAIFRPLYQETILPNIAVIGGGGELSYWLELKEGFKAFDVSFPILILRDSAVFLKRKSVEILEDLSLDLGDMLLDEELIFKKIGQEGVAWSKDDVKLKLAAIFEEIKDSDSLAQDLLNSIEIEKNKTLKGIDNLENRFVKSVKNKNEVSLKRISNIKQEIFPNEIFQERYINPIQVFLTFNEDFIPILLDCFDPLANELHFFIPVQ